MFSQTNRHVPALSRDYGVTLHPQQQQINKTSSMSIASKAKTLATYVKIPQATQVNDEAEMKVIIVQAW